MPATAAREQPDRTSPAPPPPAAAAAAAALMQQSNGQPVEHHPAPLSSLPFPSASSSPSVAPLPARGDLPTDVDAATGVVLIQSEDLPASTPIVCGPQFDSASPPTLDSLLSSFLTTGFQATNLGLAVEEINRMIRWRLSDEPLPDGETEAEQPVDRRSVRCTIFLAFTSNMISSGVREVVRYLVKHRMVDALITTCGGVEEDVIKCLHPHYVASFSLDGAALRRRGQNRIGNLIVPNKNYVAFESFLSPILDDMVSRQTAQPAVIQCPSSFCRELGLRIADDSSFLYWAARNGIPVFCFPAIDTRVLTNHGFLFLDQIERLLARKVEVLYACYDEASKGLQYVPGDLVLPEAAGQPPPTHLVEFSSDGESGRWTAASGPYGADDLPDDNPLSRHVSLRVTPDHVMFVQSGNERGSRAKKARPSQAAAGRTVQRRRVDAKEQEAKDRQQRQDEQRRRLEERQQQQQQAGEEKRRLKEKKKSADDALHSIMTDYNAHHQQREQQSGRETQPDGLLPPPPGKLRKIPKKISHSQSAAAALHPSLSPLPTSSTSPPRLHQQSIASFFTAQPAKPKLPLVLTSTASTAAPAAASPLTTPPPSRGRVAPATTASSSPPEGDRSQGEGEPGSRDDFLRPLPRLALPPSRHTAGSRKALQQQRLTQSEPPSKQVNDVIELLDGPDKENCQDAGDVEQKTPSKRRKASTSLDGAVHWTATRAWLGGRQGPVVVTPHGRVKAGDLLMTSGYLPDKSHIRLLACAKTGFTPQPGVVPVVRSGVASVRRQQVQDDLELSDAQFRVFLQLFGFWLGDGSMSYVSKNGRSGEDSVAFCQIKQTDIDWLEQQFHELGVRRRRIQGKIQLHQRIYDRAWFEFFDDTFGAKYKNSRHYQEETPAVTVEDLTAEDGDSSDDGGIDGGDDDDEEQLERIKSVKFLPGWTLTDLSAAELQLVIDGLRRADCDWSSDDNAIYTSSTRFRDQLMQALLHCGHSPYAELKHRKGRVCPPTIAGGEPIVAKHDGWRVRWADLSSSMGKGSCWPSLSRRQCITSAPYSRERDGRTWCVKIEHKDHLIIAQRAERNDNVVTKQSRPIVVGNCPALTDGSIGDMIFFHSAASSTSSPLILDIAADICRLNDLALLAEHSGQIILGGGVAKHHCCNANLMRNGADFSVYVNTGVEYDGSDAGASPDEAVSWGKIRLDARPVKVWGDATIIFPLLVSQTFVKHHHNSPSRQQQQQAEQERPTVAAVNGKH